MLLPPKTDTVVPLRLCEPSGTRVSRQPVTQETRVLIVDDDAVSAQLLCGKLELEGCSCEVASSGDRALSVVRNLGCDLVICDMQTAGANEFALLKRLKSVEPHVPVIVGSANGTIVDAVQAVKHGAFQYVAKPFDVADLIGFIVQATVDSPQYRKTSPPPQRGQDVANGELEQTSSVMRELVESIALVARSNTPVLILGESGTGKERVARAIHASGPRASHPFVAINTSAIPEQLLESELFGHVRGAFTGATQARRGLLQEAHGGSFLLDEIGDMPLMLQPKLLRVLQFGETRPVGSDRIGNVDVRVIAATHRDLEVLVREGRFREDLRYRLNVIPLVVPPLRNRRQDIAPLVARFLAEAQDRTRTSPVNSFSDEAMHLLTEGAWPGNVRELQNTIERLVVLGREAQVTAGDLAFLQDKAPATIWPPAEDTPWTLKQMNERYLQWALARSNGSKPLAAEILDINLSTLYRWERAKH